MQIVYSAKHDQADDTENKQGNVSSIKTAGLTLVSHPRTKPSQPHNKFMILFEGEKPKQVWTGSTNITEAGIFGQCNTGHWIVDHKIAAQYYEYWKSIVDDPSMGVVAKESTKIQADTDLRKLPNNTYVFFSPRDLPKKKGQVPARLKNYAALIDAAKESVCMVLPFNIDDVFKNVYREKKKYLRSIIFEKAAETMKVKSTDINIKLTAGAIMESKVEEYAKEVNAKFTSKAGILYAIINSLL